MSCYRCAEKFSLFKKEIGCGNCGFGFCSKCCSNKAVVPRKDNKKLNVCNKCFEQLAKQSNDSKPAAQNEHTPPKNFLKLVETNKEKELNNIDDQLSRRLEQLNPKKSTAPVPSEDELEKRLRNLQGAGNVTQYSSRLPTQDKIKTSDDLIKKLSEEVNIETKMQVEEEEELKKLEERLKRIQEFSSSTVKPASNEVTSDDMNPAPRETPRQDPSDELVKKMLLEAEKAYKSKRLESESDEDTWCCICNGDAHLRCIDCDKDYYCKRCYKETHKSGEYKQHRKKDL